jgi:hypothetical protein
MAGSHSSGTPALRKPAKKVISKSARVVGTAKNPEACKRAMLELWRAAMICLSRSQYP